MNAPACDATLDIALKVGGPPLVYNLLLASFRDSMDVVVGKDALCNIDTIARDLEQACHGNGIM